MWEEFKAWLQEPFQTDMDALHWFLFVGLFIAISVIWGIILRHLKEVV